MDVPADTISSVLLSLGLPYCVRVIFDDASSAWCFSLQLGLWRHSGKVMLTLDFLILGMGRGIVIHKSLELSPFCAVSCKIEWSQHVCHTLNTHTHTDPPLMSCMKPRTFFFLLPPQLPSIIILIMVWGWWGKLYRQPKPSVWNWGDFAKFIPGLWRLSQRSQIRSLVFSTPKGQSWKKMNLRASRVYVQIYMKFRKFLRFLFLVLAEEPLDPSLSVRLGWVGCIKS